MYATLPPVDIRLLDEQEHDDLPGRTHVINLAKGPPCPDPFALVKSELIPFSDNMKLLVASENPILSQAASHFFEKRHGKRFRPTIVMLLAQALENVHKDADDVVFERQTRLGQVTEMIHVASLIHDDVLDDADTRRGGDAIHKMYQQSSCVIRRLSVSESLGPPSQTGPHGRRASDGASLRFASVGRNHADQGQWGRRQKNLRRRQKRNQ